ncbi:O-antigen ligase family protein [Planktomarina temperata]|nr:O-antigen ligase family protein [Planktomarina temperata]
MKLDIGIFQLSVGDFVILLSLPWLYLNGGRLPKWTLYISGFVFLSLFISMVLNSGMGLNSTFSVPLKILASGIIYYELSNLNQSKLWTLIVGALIMVFIINMILFTGLGYFSKEIFNRNELFSYLLGLSCLYLIIYSKHSNSEGKFFLVVVSIIVLLILLGFITQSRQGIISGSIILLATIVYRIRFKNFLPVIAISFIVVGVIIKPLLEVADERFAKRIETITELAPKTRADQFRLNNALYVLNNFDKALWFGKGATAFVKEGPYQKVVHNAYLTSLYETGLFGLSVLSGCLVFMLLPLRIGFKNRKTLPPSLILPTLFMLAFFIQGFFIEILAKTTFYVLIGCSAHLIKQQRLFLYNKKNGKC